MGVAVMTLGSVCIDYSMLAEVQGCLSSKWWAHYVWPTSTV